MLNNTFLRTSRDLRVSPTVLICKAVFKSPWRERGSAGMSPGREIVMVSSLPRRSESSYKSSGRAMSMMALRALPL
jgi:hypothetical protein